MSLIKQHQTMETTNLKVIRAATREEIARVSSARPKDLDGRSQWLLFQMTNGLLILGAMPQGDLLCKFKSDLRAEGLITSAPHTPC